MIVASGFWSVLLRHPTSWLALGVNVACVVGFHVWFDPPWPVALGVITLGLMLLALWPPLFARSVYWAAARSHAQQYLDRQTVARIQALEADLRRLGAEQAVAQLRSLRDKLRSLTEVVERRLDAGELAAGRYRATGDQVYLSAVDNLQDIAATLTSIAAIDEAQLRHREQALLARGADAGTARELASVRERRALHAEQSARIAELLAENESAMTALSNAAAALANVRTRHGHASTDVATAMADLEALAERAPRYAVHGSGRRRGGSNAA